MYRFKYYYKDGTIKLSTKSYENISDFDSEIRKLTKNESFTTTLNDKKDFHAFLNLAIKEYEKNYNNIYRIDIIDNNTNKILDYVDKSECLVDGKKGHLLYDPNSGEAINAKIEDNYDNGNYRFKYYYNDGTSEISGCYGKKPELMYNDFDGLMDWDEYYALADKNLSTHEILGLAMKVYKGFLPDFYRIEIINDKTNEIVDYIDTRNN